MTSSNNSGPLDSSQMLVHVLHDTALLRAFRCHLKKSLCSENVDFWLVVDNYQGLGSEEERVTKSRWIMSEFVASTAPKQVNIDFNARNNIFQCIMREEAPRAMFDDAQAQVFELLRSDCLPRFLNSPLYQAFKVQQDAVRQAKLQSFFGAPLSFHGVLANQRVASPSCGVKRQHYFSRPVAEQVLQERKQQERLSRSAGAGKRRSRSRLALTPRARKATGGSWLSKRKRSGDAAATAFDNKAAACARTRVNDAEDGENAGRSQLTRSAAVVTKKPTGCDSALSRSLTITPMALTRRRERATTTKYRKHRSLLQSQERSDSMASLACHLFT